MKFNTIDLLSASKNIVLPILTLLLLTTIPLYIHDTSPSLLHSLQIIINNGSISLLPQNNPSSPSPSHSPSPPTNTSTTLFQSLHIDDTNGSITTNDSTNPLQSPEINFNNGSTNNSSSPSLLQSGRFAVRSPEININNGSTNNSSSPSLQSGRIVVRSPEINNINNGSTNNSSSPSLQSGQIVVTNDSAGAMSMERGCNIFKGNWVPYPKGPYYTNETKCVIDDRQNCMKFGRPDSEFLKWRWRPDECELPLFDAVKFLELVRGKSLAFLGDSVGRNQMQSLVCLLASAANPIDVSYTPDTRFRRWLYPDYNFTIIALWSPLLVKSNEVDPQSYLMNLYLDEPDSAWTSQIENVDMVILSAGQWFFRPFMYYKKGKLVGCHNCNKKNITNFIIYHGYKMAFRTTFKALLGLHNFKGIVFLRAFSPAHFEGEWNDGGRCEKTRPFTKGEVKLDGYNFEMYKTQVKELRAAEMRGRKRGLKFRLLDTTEAMVMRPDGHPNHYGHWPEENKTIADCVHWCMPGPIDTWNEFLLQMLKMEK